MFRNYYGPDGLLFEDANLPWTRDLQGAAFAQFLHAWNPYFGGGMSGVISNATTFATVLAQASVSFLGVPLSTALVYPLVLSLAFAGAYGLARALGASAPGGAALGLFYVGNPWFMDRLLDGHTAILIAVAVLAWLFWAVARQRAAPHAYGALTLALAGAELQSDARIAYFAFVGLYLVAAARALGGPGTLGQRLARNLRLPLTWYPAVAPFAAFALNAWWTLPFLIYPNVNPVRPFYPPLEEVADLSSHCDLAHAFALSGTWSHAAWSAMSRFGGAVFIVWYAAFVVLFAAALRARGASPAGGALARLAIAAGLLLSTGTHYLPVDVVYGFYRNVPFAAFFRDPDKFGCVVVLGLLVGVASAWRGFARAERAIVTAAALAICIPLALGTFSLPNGFGFQAFAERPHFEKLLAFLRRQAGFPAFRVALVPPWTAEQSLRPGAWPVANPLVFQLDVPTLDAKLISTGTATNLAAWRAFDALYWGLDPHPARTFSRLAVRYFVVLDRAVLSPGAGQTPYYGVATSEIEAALAADPAIREVYRDGAYRIYANAAYVAPLRTAALPLVAGDLSDEVRTALPADAFGDAVGGPDGPRAGWPRGIAGFGETALDRCLAADPRVATFATYPHAPPRADWKHYWSASDYLQRGTGDPVLDRALSRLSLPFVFSTSERPFALRVATRMPARVYVDAATVGGQAVTEASLDGGPPVAWVPSTLGFSWHAVGEATPGTHVVTLTGSALGTAFKGVALAPVPCTAGGIGLERGGAAAGRAYYVPGPVAWAAIALAAGRWTVRIGGAWLDVNGRDTLVSAAAPSGAVPPGIRAFAWDAQPVLPGIAFATASGAHELAGFARAGSNLAGPLVPDLGGFVAEVRGLRAGEGLDVELASRSRAPLRVAVADGALGRRWTETTVPARGTATVLVRPLTGLVRVIVARLANAGAPPLGVTAFRVVDGFRRRVVVPAAGVRLPDGAAVALEPASARAVPLTFAADGASLETAAAPAATFVDPRAGALNRLRLRGARARVSERELVTEYYRTLLGDVESRPFAEFEAGPAARDVDLAVPAFPGETSFAFAIRRPDGSNGSLSFAAAQLAAGRPDGAGYFVRLPASLVARPARAVPLAAADSESFRVARAFAGPLVGNFSYDPYWSYGDAPHLIADGTSNLWVASAPGRGAYALQAVYRRLLVASAALWIVLLAALAALFARARARPAA